MYTGEVIENKTILIKNSIIESIIDSKEEFKAERIIDGKERLVTPEEFKVLLLNRAHKVIGVVNASQGGFCGTVADVKLIFGAALKAATSAIILAHNHPSGNLKPSEADIRLTKKMKEAGQLLELPVLDHLIVTAEGYYSFADEGLM